MLALPAYTIADAHRFHHFHDYRLRGLRTDDPSWKICVCLLGIVGTCDDDHPGIMYAQLSWSCGSVSVDADIVLQDAFSSKYKNALHSGVFESAVKRYRQKTKSQSEKKEREKEGKEINFHVTVQPSDVKESSSRAQRNLENLPAKVLGQTELFHRHIQFLVQSETGGIFTTNLESMLDDVDRAHKMDEKLRDEILQDEDARNVRTLCFTALLNKVTKYVPRNSASSALRVSPLPRSMRRFLTHFQRHFES